MIGIVTTCIQWTTANASLPDVTYTGYSVSTINTTFRINRGKVRSKGGEEDRTLLPISAPAYVTQRVYEKVRVF